MATAPAHIASTFLTFTLFFAAQRTSAINHPPANVDFSVTHTIHHDSDPLTTAITVELFPVATDQDGDQIYYLWSCPGTIPARQDVHTTVFPGSGVYNCGLVATDSYGDSTPGNVVVTILPEPNTIPVADAGVDTTWTIPHDESPSTITAAVVLDGLKSIDGDGDELLFNWTCTPGVAYGVERVLTVDLPQGVHACMLRVTDPYGAHHEDTVTVTVNAEPNETPVANAGADQAYTVPHDFYIGTETNTVRVTLYGGATADADGDRMKHLWDCGNGVRATVLLPFPVKMGSIGPDKTQPARQGVWPGDGDDTTHLAGFTGGGEGDLFSGVYTHQPNQVDVTLPEGTHTCTLTTTDTYGATSTDSVEITIAPEPNTDPDASGG